MHESKTNSSTAVRNEPPISMAGSGLRVIGGRAGAEYGPCAASDAAGFHLDIVDNTSPAPAPAA